MIRQGRSVTLPRTAATATALVSASRGCDTPQQKYILLYQYANIYIYIYMYIYIYIHDHISYAYTIQIIYIHDVLLSSSEAKTTKQKCPVALASSISGRAPFALRTNRRGSFAAQPTVQHLLHWGSVAPCLVRKRRTATVPWVYSEGSNLLAAGPIPFRTEQAINKIKQ